MTLPWVTQLVFGIIDTEFVREDFKVKYVLKLNFKQQNYTRT